MRFPAVMRNALSEQRDEFHKFGLATQQKSSAVARAALLECVTDD